MKILYYDCFSGISGDMNLGALLDLGIDEKYLIQELNKLNLKGYEIKVSRGIRKGIEGTKVDVILQEHKHESPHVYAEGAHNHESPHVYAEGVHNHESPHNDAKGVHNHEQPYDDAEGTHNHKHVHGCSQEEHSHAHMSNKHSHDQQRNLKDIQEIIDNSKLSSKVKELSNNMFMKVAVAEAKVHGKSLYDVHFHEVGAVDSIVDIIGAAILITYLNVDKIMSSSIELGGGFVKCAHGIIPVPAPATVEILQGIPVKLGAVPFETTTPTGAAILAANVDEFKDDNNFIINKIGYGIGNRDTEIPNVLRVMLVEEKKLSNDSKASDDVFQEILECNIDDINPELYEYIIDRLFNEGALDVYLTPIIMKKGRPSVKVSVLCEEAKLEKMKEVLFKETTTFGVRSFKVNKTMLHREFIKVNTSYGEITIKEAYYKGEKLKGKLEYEECKVIASRMGISAIDVYENLKREILIK